MFVNFSFTDETDILILLKERNLFNDLVKIWKFQDRGKNNPQDKNHEYYYGVFLSNDISPA